MSQALNYQTPTFTTSEVTKPTWPTGWLHDSGTFDNRLISLDKLRALPGDEQREFLQQGTVSIVGLGANLVTCVSPDGWSLHEAGASDEDIALGWSTPLAFGPWNGYCDVCEEPCLDLQAARYHADMMLCDSCLESEV